VAEVTASTRSSWRGGGRAAAWPPSERHTSRGRAPCGRHAIPAGDELDDIALEAADDALVSILRRLDDFRGDSRFSTWVYKFAVLEAAVKLRKRAWQGRELPLEPEAWDAFESNDFGPDVEVEQRELVTGLQNAIAETLTPHQRRVLVAVALNGVPIDVLADRHRTTRGALYKTLHDARHKLRGELAERGLMGSSARTAASD
jgi:RNA polymerase sigma-70 factor, ECF subfamily